MRGFAPDLARQARAQTSASSTQRRPGSPSPQIGRQREQHPAHQSHASGEQSARTSLCWGGKGDRLQVVALHIEQEQTIDVKHRRILPQLAPGRTMKRVWCALAAFDLHRINSPRSLHEVVDLALEGPGFAVYKQRPAAARLGCQELVTTRRKPLGGLSFERRTPTKATRSPPPARRPCEGRGQADGQERPDRDPNDEVGPRLSHLRWATTECTLKAQNWPSLVCYPSTEARRTMMDKETMRCESERLLRLQAHALDAAVNTIIITDSRATILWANEAAVRNYGYARSELMGRNQRMLSSGHHDESFYAELWQTISAGRPWCGTIQNRKKTGELLQEQMTITPVTDSAGVVEHYIAIKEDITESKRLETSLQLARFAMETSTDAIFVMRTDGQLLYGNSAAARVVGLAQDQLHGWYFHQLDLNLDPMRWVLRVESLRKHRAINYESRCGVSELGVKVVDISLSLQCFEGEEYISASVRDISERRRTEESLRQMVEGTASTTGRAFFKSCVRHLAEVLGMRYALITEHHPGPEPRLRALASWSDGHFWELGDYPLADNPCTAVIERAQAVVFPEGLRRLYPNSALLEQFPAESYEGLPLIASDARVIGHLAVLDDRPLADDRGRSSILKIFADRAAAELERQRTLERLRDAKERADAANRAKGRFLANMSHELRTPLNGILGYAQVLKRDPSLGEKQREGLRVIERSGEHLLDLINDVLDLSKVEAQKVEIQPVVFSLPLFLDEIARAFTVRAADKGLEFRSELHPRLPRTVQGDERRLRQVLFNLLDNAIKFTSSGHITFAVQPLPDSILFEVADTGCGIPRSMQSRLFQPFAQVGHNREGEIKGTGLGLAISKKMVELLGGELAVESDRDLGSRFFFAIALPAVRQAPLAAISTDCQVVGYEGGRRHALVVDSNQQRRTVLRQLLEPIGFVVEERTRRAEALEVQRSPDVILIELGVPEEEGLSVVRAIRASGWGQSVPILALTPPGHEIDHNAAIAAGCSGFIATPYKESELLKRIGQALGIEWIVREAEALSSAGQVMELPPTQQLRELHDLCMLGDVMAVRAKAEQMLAEHPRYETFGSTLLELAGQFRMRALRELLAQKLEQPRAER